MAGFMPPVKRPAAPPKQGWLATTAPARVFQASPAPTVRQVMASRGQPLDSSLRAWFEPRLGAQLAARGADAPVPEGRRGLAATRPGDAREREANSISQTLVSLAPVPHGGPEDRGGGRYDLADVRIHTDASAAESARDLQAAAYTVGRDVVFAAGRYSPSSLDGQRLLAHELVHVAQQDGLGATPGIAERAPVLARQEVERDLTTLSDEELFAERQRLLDWLSKHSMVEVEYSVKEDRAQELDAEFARRKPGAAPQAGPQADPGLKTGGFTANAAIQGYDAMIRVDNYVRPAEDLAKKILADVESGKITHFEGRDAAFGGRNDLLAAAREKLSPGGRSFSKAIKEEGKALPDLIAKYARKLLVESPELMKKYGLETLDSASLAFDAAKYKAALAELAETAEISNEIIKAAGRTSRIVTGVAKFSKVAGPIGFVLGAGVSGYEIWTAPEGQKLHAAGREASGFAGGFLGSVGGGLAAGWTASIFCGPAAPACALVVSVVVVGAAAYGGGKLAEAGYEAVTAPPTTPDSGAGGAGGGRGVSGAEGAGGN